MKFSENWLRSLVDLVADRDELTRRLTMSGLEVAAVEPQGGALEGVIVARILACEPHPDADRLRVCRVDAGDAELQVVCGASNARAGLVAPLATIGARLPGGGVIEAARLRGVASNGMLCSARELGIDVDASGLMELPEDAPVGEPLAGWLGLPDTSIEIELTPNRGDCLGMLGLADEVAAEFGVRAKPSAVPPRPAQLSAPREIRLEAGAACPRYLGRAVRGLDVAAPTPVWMAQRLRAAGVKPISIAVDVTNYVMLETGQPLHAFDEARLDGAIVVRHARQSEILKLLDGREVELAPGFVVIADERKSLAVAGVMGGFDSRVTASTRDVFLEAAHFAPAAIMGRARKLGLVTDAAHRFERGVDPALPRTAIERASALLLDIAGGQAGEVIEAALRKHLPRSQAVSLRRARIARVLGASIDDGEVERILTALGMVVEAEPGGWRVLAPSRRFDIEREEDLIEEVARIHGYDAIPASLPAGSPPAPRGNDGVLPVMALGIQLAARGYQEAICHAFVDPALLQNWHLDARAVALANPLSAEMAVMRTSLLPGLVEALRRNRNRQQLRVRLFETGKVFCRSECAPDTGITAAATAAPTAAPAPPIETEMLAAVTCGDAGAEQWAGSRRALDFFDVKGDLESLLALSSQPDAWSFDATNLPSWLHPGRSARVLRAGRPAGVVGALHPSLEAALDLPETHVFAIAQDALRQRAVPAAEPLPRFPSIRRDIAIELDDAIAWSAVAASVRAELPELLHRLVLFDCFRGPGLGPGRKSLAMGLILQDGSRTLTDADADGCVAATVAALGREFGAHLRT